MSGGAYDRFGKGGRKKCADCPTLIPLRGNRDRCVQCGDARAWRLKSERAARRYRERRRQKMKDFNIHNQPYDLPRWRLGVGSSATGNAAVKLFWRCARSSPI